MNFAKFFSLSFSLCINFVAKISFFAFTGFIIDKYFEIFPLLTVALSVVGVYVGFRSLIVLVNRYKFNA